MKKPSVSTILLILTFLVGLSLLLYPTVSDYWNSMHATQAIVDYDSAIRNLAPKDYTSLFEAADSYNRAIRRLDFPLMNYEEVPGYTEILDIGGKGIMAYITIPAINVELPVYHGTDDGVLQVAVGHIQGTSLPVGGPSTHSVLSAHRGLPSARLFTDLDQLTEGDTFSLSVLNRTLTYQIDQILIVEPTEVTALYVEEGKDYCTLVTCTPYGINSHRMLVRGRRIENPEQVREIRVTGDAMLLDPIVVTPLVAAPMLLVLLLWLLLAPPKPRPRSGGM